MRLREIQQIPHADYGDSDVAEDFRYFKSLKPQPTGAVIDGRKVVTAKDHNSLWYGIWGKKNSIAYVNLVPTNEHGIDGYFCTYLGVHPTFRGTGLATKLYAHLVNDVGLTLFSSLTQTVGGTSVWLRLAQRHLCAVSIVHDGQVLPVTDPLRLPVDPFSKYETVFMARRHGPISA